jgi:hypothetical protein
MKYSIFLLLVVALVTCDDFGANKNFTLNADKKYLLLPGQTLTYTSGAIEEKFEVQKVVNGTYEDSQSGTCAKPRLFIYEYQVVYMKPADSVSATSGFIGDHETDCGAYFRLNDKLICSLNVARATDQNTLEFEFSDKINWLDEFMDRVNNFTKHYKTLKLANHDFKDVFQYHVPNGKRIDTLYYTRHAGFVAYRLKNGALFVLNQ